jgi:uncharacterized protein (TIGR02145 family)
MLEACQNWGAVTPNEFCESEGVYILTVNVDFGGTVTGGGIYDEGTEATITATANSVCTFRDWMPAAGIADPNSPNTTVSMTTNRTITARFNCESGGGTFTDPRDGQIYRTVQIGGQIWMAQNLNYQTVNSWCYDNNSAHCDIYGRLYNWEAAMTACPVDWRLPENADWLNLAVGVGGQPAARALKSQSGWDQHGNGTDAFGFTALSSGTYLPPPDIGFFGMGWYTHWWSGTDRAWIDGGWRGYYRGIGGFNDNEWLYDGTIPVERAFSVRCVMDD